MIRPALILVCVLPLLGATCLDDDERPTTPEGWVREEQPPERIVEGGSELDESALLAELDGAPLVIIAARDNEPADRSTQLRLTKGLYARHSNRSVALEIIETPFQGALDEWIAGRLDDTVLRHEVEWSDRSTRDFSLDRPLLNFLRARRIPSLAIGSDSRAPIGQPVHSPEDELLLRLVEILETTGTPVIALIDEVHLDADFSEQIEARIPRAKVVVTAHQGEEERIENLLRGDHVVWIAPESE